MRRSLGSLALLAALLGAVGLAGCGAEEPDEGADPTRSRTGGTGPSDTGAPDPTGSTPAPTGSGDGELVEIVAASNVGGRVTPTPTYVGDRLTLLRYVGQFPTDFAEEITAVVSSHRPEPGRVLAAAVIALECSVPETAYVRVGSAGAEVVPGRIPSPDLNCVVPVTSVAIVELPAGAVPVPGESTATADS